MPEILTPVKAIRAHCLDCMCGQATEVRLCPITDCSLYPYRMGHNPNRKGKGGKFAPKAPTQVGETEMEESAGSGYAFGESGEKELAELEKKE